VTAFNHGIFLDDDGVGGIRDHAAGEDPHCLAHTNRLFERAARRDLADHLEPRRRVRGVGRSYRIAVHRRHRQRRLGAQRRDVARQHAMVCRVERDHFFGQRFGACENRRQRLSNRHQCQSKTPKAKTPRARSSPFDLATRSCLPS